ncbi:hypothetical protein DFH09DRAFT_1498040 [Mycena vulgaris]|nr:hypothetical protein DFH09DRAFT_1498040 [Mycena vulgaris]
MTPATTTTASLHGLRRRPRASETTSRLDALEGNMQMCAATLGEVHRGLQVILARQHAPQPAAVIAAPAPITFATPPVSTQAPAAPFVPPVVLAHYSPRVVPDAPNVPIVPLLPSTHRFDTQQSVTIKSWNINGAFALQMSCPIFRSELEMYDVNLFNETHLRPSQHDTIDLPPGYTIVSRTRRPKSSFDQSWGGVADSLL